MIDIKTLKRQHRDISNAVNALKASIGKAEILSEDAYPIAQQISTLAGVLKIHLGTEDRFMYPYLLESGKDDLKKIAQDYVAEMGHISTEFVRYKDRYNTKSKIIGDVSAFISETKRIVQILEDRIRKEDANLYPIL